MTDNEAQRETDEVMADIAATTLANLASVQFVIGKLMKQFMLLASHADHRGDEDMRERLLMSLAAACVLRADSRTVVRDMASTLPIRGLEFGE